MLLFQEIEGQEIPEKSKLAKRSSFKKSKHKTIEVVSVPKEPEENGETGDIDDVIPQKELASIYSHR